MALFFPLTQQQKMVLDFILQFTGERQYPPTIAEIQSATGIRNPGLVYKVLHALERKMYITRNKGMPRGIFLAEAALSLPDPKQMALFAGTD